MIEFNRLVSHKLTLIIFKSKKCNTAVCGCEKMMKKEVLSGSTQEVSHRILPHLNHHHHHHHHPLPLHPPSPLHALPAPKKNPVGLFHFLFCFFNNLSCFQLRLLHSFNHLPEKKLSNVKHFVSCVLFWSVFSVAAFCRSGNIRGSSFYSPALPV